MGRANINNLYEWFLAQYGGENTIAYQQARDAFIQSLAGYSLILYLLQIKDRHNGNVMIDRDGHLIHIDFGFIFDITPGGIKFELSPFKLTAEMIQIMGGRQSKHYRRYLELCIRAFLVSRPYAEPIIQMVRLMLNSGLPCFKGEATIERLRQRFQLDLNEKQAASFMHNLVDSARRSVSTTLYDGYQKLTNGIPY
jgi:phosphatidylinositol 4-kinase